MTAADHIRRDEGFRASVYDDSTGQPITKGTVVQGYATIGFGFCIDAFKGSPLPEEVAEFWLAHLLEGIETELAERWPPFKAQPEDIRDALLNMAYNLGVSGLLGFRLMLDALERGDRETAAVNALDSTWAQQVGDRARRIANQIRGHEVEAD